ncbi:hypothetical protein L798_15025 [Zootermopsis nevadensis]|uniref:RRM domain-containing protein n=1 Tax=Zootermopsis nevadensis TaxID=136037 RepID=A0A067QNU6_ZOONE|nr:hypothetical protein L798_15025 [Zootermopsis nevadensis]
MVSVAFSDFMVQLVEYMISKGKLDDDEHDDESSVSTEGPPVRKLCVGNISDRTSYSDLRRLFRQYGKVVDAYISRHLVTQERKKYGFVIFKYPEDALRVLKLKRGELRLHFRTLNVAPAYSWHQPVELPDGRVLWKSNSHGRKHDPCQEIDSPESQTHNKATTPSGSESTLDDEKESETVGGCDLPSQTSARGTVEQQQEGETKNGKVKRREVKGKCKIHILNDDCLMHIFSYLTTKERFRIEIGMLFSHMCV